MTAVAGIGRPGHERTLYLRGEDMTTMRTAEQIVDAAVAAIGSDGLRLVVWGLGADEQSAIEDAARWVEESHPAPELTCVKVNLDQVARIAAGAIDCSALGIVPSSVHGVYAWLDKKEGRS
jgi:hypothetical protein